MTLVDKKLSEVIQELSNPNESDRLHVIRYISGVWSSYFVRIGTIKDYAVGVQSTGVKQLGSITGGSDEIEYIAENSILQFVSVSVEVENNLTLKVGTTTGGEEVLPVTDYLSGEKSFPVFYPCHTATTLYINLSGTGSAKITLVFTENLF